MKAWFQSIRRCRNAQDLKCFGKKNTKKKRKKKKRKKEKRKSTKAWVWVIFYPLRAYKSINYEWSLLFLTRRASRGALTSALFHFLSFFFFVSLHLRRTSPKGKGLLVVYQRQKCFLKHENHALSRARVWRHGKGSNNTIPSPSSYFQLLVLIPFIMLEGLKGVLRSMVFGQFTVTFFFVQLTVKFAWRLIFSAVLRLTVNPLRSIPMQLWLRLAYCNFLLSVSPNTSRISLKIKKKLLTNHYAYFFSLSQQNS